MDNKKTYGSIEELKLMLTLYPNQRKDIIEETGKRFKLNNEYAWFVVAEDGNCALFNKDYELDDLSKVKEITGQMIKADIKKINIPDSVTSIGKGAFSWCASLASINIPDSVTSIGKKAFSWCASLASINIPDSVKSIKDWAFGGCTSLTSISISDSVERIGDYAFYGCIYLKEVIFKGKTLDEVKSMKNYPWRIEDKSIIRCEA